MSRAKKIHKPASASASIGTCAVQLQNKYGRDLVYPMNPTADAFASLIERKTFDNHHLEMIEKLGFTIEWVPFVLERGNQ